MKKIPTTLEGSTATSPVDEPEPRSRLEVKPPDQWTDEERLKVARAIAEHRLSRVDLFYWQEIIVAGRNPYHLATEMMLNLSEVKERAHQAQERLVSTFERPS
jgi:hypothetical protein